MPSYKPKPLKMFFLYPLTWAALGVIILCHGLYAFIFRPSLFWLLMAFILDLSGLALWFVLAFKSEAFKKHYNRMPYEQNSKELLALIQGCSPAFRSAAEECIQLINRINADFPDQLYSQELNLMLLNIKELAQNNSQLYERSQKFGTEEQKKQMNSLLQHQTEAMQNTLTTLKAFSGNLTLLATNVEQTQSVTNQLKDLNDGLKEVLEES